MSLLSVFPGSVSSLFGNECQTAAVPCKHTSKPNFVLQGFTILELCVVIVIIALVVGGVIAGNELMRAMSIRQQLTQIEQLKIAIQAFDNKYNCLPGDCSRAVTLGLGTNTAWHNGNGDDFIGFEGELSSCVGSGTRETINTYMHLRLSGLLDMKGIFEGYMGGSTCMNHAAALTKLPEAAIGNRTFIFMGDIANIRWGQDTYGPFLRPAPKAFALSGSNASTTQLPTVLIEDSENMDIKVDDGFPTTGRVGLAPTGAPWSGFIPRSGTTEAVHQCIVGTYARTKAICASRSGQGGNRQLVVFMNQY